MSLAHAPGKVARTGAIAGSFLADTGAVYTVLPAAI